MPFNSSDSAAVPYLLSSMGRDKAGGAGVAIFVRKSILHLDN